MDDPVVHVSDHAVLRYLERAHGLDVEAVREYLAGLADNGARLGATGVVVESVKLVLRRRADDSVVVTSVYKARWPIRRGGE